MHRLNAVGQDSPKAILALKHFLRDLQTGERMEFWVDRSVALDDLPTFCMQQNHHMLMAREQQGHLVVVIEKSCQHSATMGTGQTMLVESY